MRYRNACLRLFVVLLQDLLGGYLSVLLQDLMGAVCWQRQGAIYGMRNKVQYEAKAEDNGIQQS